MSEASMGSAEARSGYQPGYQVVAEQVLKLLIADGLQPGDYLGTQAQLAQRLGVSHTVLREAVKILITMGRIRTQKGKGLYVEHQDSLATEGFFLPADLDHVLMLFEFRRVQEETAARLAAVRATPPDLRAVKTAAEDSLAAAKAGDIEGFSDTDDTFHQALAEASHNRFLTSAVSLARRLQRQAGLFRPRDTEAGSHEQAAEEHLRIADAVAAGDPDAATEAIVAHLDKTRDQYQQLITDFMRLGQRQDPVPDPGATPGPQPRT